MDGCSFPAATFHPEVMRPKIPNFVHSVIWEDVSPINLQSKPH
jgi:hypothetical protein